jgi:hypothetical protein
MQRILIFIGIYLIIKLISNSLLKREVTEIAIERDSENLLSEKKIDYNNKSVDNNNKSAGNKIKNEHLEFPNLDVQVTTRNMYVESHNELNLSLFGTEITAQEVIEAYERELNKHMDNISKGIPDNFNVDSKREARDYLLAYLSESNEHK